MLSKPKSEKSDLIFFFILDKSGQVIFGSIYTAHNDHLSNTTDG